MAIQKSSNQTINSPPEQRYPKQQTTDTVTNKAISQSTRTWTIWEGTQTKGGVYTDRVG